MLCVMLHSSLTCDLQEDEMKKKPKGKRRPALNSPSCWQQLGQIHTGAVPRHAPGTVAESVAGAAARDASGAVADCAPGAVPAIAPGAAAGGPPGLSGTKANSCEEEGDGEAAAEAVRQPAANHADESQQSSHGLLPLGVDPSADPRIFSPPSYFPS